MRCCSNCLQNTGRDLSLANWLKLCVVLGGALGAALLSALPASAALEFCNRSSYLLDAASAHEVEDGFLVQGWFKLNPGECKKVFSENLGDKEHYAFARTRPAHGASRRLTSGDRMLCIDTVDFSFVSANGCTDRGLQKVEFARVATDGRNDWTATFSESGNYDDKRARIAGTQRLLRELGYEPGSVDGFSGGRTTRAIKEFQKANGLTDDGKVNTSLFRALEAAGEQRQRRSGFHFCNDTQLLVWAAIGYRQSDEWRSSGWIRVPAGNCAPAMTSALDEPVYYAYAEAVTEDGETATRNDVPLVWGGDRSFCTKPTRFFIRGRTNCAARGYDEVPFQEVDVSGQETHTMRLR